MEAPKPVDTPPAVRRLVRGTILQTRTVDFTGDGRLDYIVTVKENLTHANQEVETPHTLVWISSGLKILKVEPRYSPDADYMWFINLDKDPVPEVISAWGYEDGIGYTVEKQVFGKGKRNVTLFNFSPVLMDPARESKHYWGYPWDLRDVQARRQGNHYLFRCSLNHSVKGDFENVKLPAWQRRVPILFFVGATTQADIALVTGNLGTPGWCDLKRIASEVRKK